MSFVLKFSAEKPSCEQQKTFATTKIKWVKSDVFVGRGTWHMYLNWT